MIRNIRNAAKAIAAAFAFCISFLRRKPRVVFLPRELSLIALEALVQAQLDENRVALPDSFEEPNGFIFEPRQMMRLAYFDFDPVLEIARLECGFEHAANGQEATIEWLAANPDAVRAFFLRIKRGEKEHDFDAEKAMEWLTTDVQARDIKKERTRLSVDERIKLVS